MSDFYQPPEPPQPLPVHWVERIFLKLTVAYGRDFLGRWEGIPLDAVKSDWADCLAGFAANPGAIKHALASLPDSKPPTAQEFRALCLRAPAAPMLALPEPPANPERVRSELGRMLQAKVLERDSKAWARRIVDRVAAGEVVPPHCAREARVALGLEV